MLNRYTTEQQLRNEISVMWGGIKSEQAYSDMLLGIIKDIYDLYVHVGIPSGVCMCGDSMSNHASPFTAGHSPCDSGEYYMESLIREKVEPLLIKHTLMEASHSI